MGSRLILLLFLFLPCRDSFAQSTKVSKPAKDKPTAWDLRNYTVTGCLRSEHVEALVQKAWNDVKKKDTSDINHFFVVGNVKLSETDFQSLTLVEKFIYAHHYPENFMQTCGSYDMANDMSKIYANIPYLFDGERMSERQIRSLQDNRDTTLAYLQKCIPFDTHIPLGYKKTIIEINAWELIPSILDLEERMNKKDKAVVEDPYLYSVLMQLMKNNGYSFFKKTAIYKNLYGPDESYRSTINFTQASRKEIKGLALGMYYLKNDSATKKTRELADFVTTNCGKSTRLDGFIRKAIANTAGDDQFYRTVRLPDSVFALLGPYEKFAYAHQYPESFMQNCSWYTAPTDLSKLYKNLPFITSGLKMSKRQLESLKENHDSTIVYLANCINTLDYIPLAYKQTILDLNAWEFIPVILAIEEKMYAGSKETLVDPLLYTLLIKLMQDNNFPGLKKADFYKPLYEPDEGYTKYIDFTPAIHKQLIGLAADFYRQKKAEKTQVAL